MFKEVEDCSPLFAIVSSEFLIESGDGDVLERASLGLVFVFELLEDLFPHRGGVSFENAWEVLVTLFVAPIKLCCGVLNVAHSHSLGKFHRLRPVVHPDDRFLPVSVPIFIGDVFGELSGRYAAHVGVGVRPFVSHTGVVHGGGHLDRLARC